MPAEDTAEIKVDQIPQLIFRSELGHFNEWDVRRLVKKVDRSEVIKGHYLAIDKDVNRMRKYIWELSGALRFDVETSEATWAYWKSTGEMLRAIRTLKRKNDAHLGTIAEYPPAEQAYLSRDWINVMEAHRESYGNLIEMDVLYPKFLMMITAMATALENYAEDEGLSKELEKFRVAKYDEVRKSLVTLRYKERAASNKLREDR